LKTTLLVCEIGGECRSAFADGPDVTGPRPE
jgi:hypothetical protein